MHFSLHKIYSLSYFSNVPCWYPDPGIKITINGDAIYDCMGRDHLNRDP